MTERFNKTLCIALGKQVNSHLNDWDTFLTASLFAYRTQRHDSTGFTPFELLYGRQPRLPGHPIPGQPNFGELTSAELSECAEQLAVTMDLNGRTALKRIKSAQERQQRNYNKRLKKSEELEVGDFVMIRQFRRVKKLGAKNRGPFRILLSLEQVWRLNRGQVNLRSLIQSIEVTILKS